VDVVDVVVVASEVEVVGSGVPAAEAALVMLWITGVAHTIPPAAAAFLIRLRLDSFTTAPPPCPSRPSYSAPKGSAREARNLDLDSAACCEGGNTCSPPEQPPAVPSRRDRLPDVGAHVSAERHV